MLRGIREWSSRRVDMDRAEIVRMKKLHKLCSECPDRGQALDFCDHCQKYHELYRRFTPQEKLKPEYRRKK
jgi:hypothetical protein